MKSCVRQIDSVARVGGDEFVVLLSELDRDPARSEAQATNIAEKLRSTLAEPYDLCVKHEGQADARVTHRCSASIGVRVYSGVDQNQADILKGADAAMYRAKDAGRNRVQFY